MMPSISKNLDFNLSFIVVVSGLFWIFVLLFWKITLKENLEIFLHRKQDSLIVTDTEFNDFLIQDTVYKRILQ